MRLLIFTAILVGVAAVPATADDAKPAVAKPVPLNPRLVARGEKLYARFCLSCHGVNGDGRGYSAQWLDPRPRDFTRGIFKCRSTPSGTLPQNADLLRTLQTGLYHTYMPNWDVLGDRNLEGLVEYLKTFSPRWKEEPQGESIAVPLEPADDAASKKKGEAVWNQLACMNCHGAGGKGDGASVPTLFDDWGNHIVPFDFTASPRRKCGSDKLSLYHTFMTGLNGTPMPSYADSLAPEDAWHLIHYLETLRTEKSMAVSH
jgi:mono/diheme cytochrome c family protein